MKDLATLSEEFKADFNAAMPSLQEFKQAKAYYHGNQLPPDVLHIITERGQTPIVENIYKMIVNKIMGYKIQSIQEVRLTPRQEEDRALADLLNDLLKYFSQKRNFDKEMIKRDQNLIMGGLGVIELWPVADLEGNIDIEIKALDPLSFLIDHFSTDSNALDARRFHKVLLVDEESTKALLLGWEVVYERTGDAELLAKIIETWAKEGGFGIAICGASKGAFIYTRPSPLKMAHIPSLWPNSTPMRRTAIMGFLGTSSPCKIILTTPRIAWAT
ncbi:hypothetical protein ASB7_15640 [Helicobacter ailurogastricus]|nr:hypothetical protein ASB7_15640 [Helicobacter ailurogastricus]